MSGSHSIEASPNHDQNSALFFKDPHHSIMQIENQTCQQSSHPPSVFHDAIT